MPDGLPSVVDPIELARAGARLAGALPLASMPRLVELGLARTGEVRIELEFGRDPHGQWRMSGSAECNLTVACQRCLEPMTLTVRAPIRLALVRPGTPEGGATASDDVIEVAGAVSLAALVEDELLLALPLAPMHDPRVCPVPG